MTWSLWFNGSWPTLVFVGLTCFHALIVGINSSCNIMTASLVCLTGIWLANKCTCLQSSSVFSLKSRLTFSSSIISWIFKRLLRSHQVTSPTDPLAFFLLRWPFMPTDGRSQNPQWVVCFSFADTLCLQLNLSVQRHKALKKSVL